MPHQIRFELEAGLASSAFQLPAPVHLFVVSEPGLILESLSTVAAVVVVVFVVGLFVIAVRCVVVISVSVWVRVFGFVVGAISVSVWVRVFGFVVGAISVSVWVRVFGFVVGAFSLCLSSTSFQFTKFCESEPVLAVGVFVCVVVRWFVVRGFPFVVVAIVLCLSSSSMHITKLLEGERVVPVAFFALVLIVGVGAGLLRVSSRSFVSFVVSQVAFLPVSQVSFFSVSQVAGPASSLSLNWIGDWILWLLFFRPC